MGTNYRIYSPEGHFGIMESDSGNKPTIEEKFMRELARLICDVFRISHGVNDQNLFRTLLYVAMNKEINNDNGSSGLLQQYLAHELDEVAKQMRSELHIPEGVKVNHERLNVRHKFKDITEYVKRNYCDSSEIFQEMIKNAREESDEEKGCDEECDPFPREQCGVLSQSEEDGGFL